MVDQRCLLSSPPFQTTRYLCSFPGFHSFFPHSLVANESATYFLEKMATSARELHKLAVTSYLPASSPRSTCISQYRWAPGVSLQSSRHNLCHLFQLFSLSPPSSVFSCTSYLPASFPRSTSISQYRWVPGVPLQSSDHNLSYLLQLQFFSLSLPSSVFYCKWVIHIKSIILLSVLPS